MSLIGSLIYLSIVSQPDISYAVGKISQKMSNPTQSDWIAAKRILRYLKKEKTLGSIYSDDKSKTLVGYSDSDWGGEIPGRKSISGYKGECWSWWFHSVIQKWELIKKQDQHQNVEPDYNNNNQWQFKHYL